MRENLFALTALLSLAVPGFGGGREKDAELARKIVPFVGEMTFVVAHVDMDRINVAVLGKALKGLGIEEKDAAEALGALSKMESLLREVGGRQLFVLLQADAPRLDEDFVFVIPLQEKEKAREFLKTIAAGRHWKAKLDDDVLVMTTVANFDRIARIKPVNRPELTKALAAFPGDAAKVVAAPPALVVRTFAEVAPRLPRELGGGSTRELGEGFGWIGVGVSEKLDVTFRLKARDEKSAQRFQDLAQKAMEIPSQEPSLKLLLSGIVKARKRFLPRVVGDQLILRIEQDSLLETAAPALRELRGSAARAQSRNNLLQIVLGFHGYHDVNKALPTAYSRDAKGRPLLSWRVHLLPYLEQDVLYRQFRLKEPWDSPHNKKLINRMPEVYASPLSPAPAGKTTYLVPTGKGTIFSGPKGMRLTHISDGSSNTILTLEVRSERAVFWTQPIDYPIDQKDLLAGLVHPERKGFHAAFADGAVHWLAADIAPATLRALLTAKGGEPIGPP